MVIYIIYLKVQFNKYIYKIKRKAEAHSHNGFIVGSLHHQG